MAEKKVIIAGGGPAGLTAAHELLKSCAGAPFVYERDTQVGGISKTVDYKGNRIDIGGHRFFSKNDTVMNWWTSALPIQGPSADPDKIDRVMLRRSRKSRILWMRKLFDYPLKMSFDTVSKLGFGRTAFIGISYVRAALFPVKPEKNLEEFFINRFGRRLYLQFFKDYTEKVWGMPCSGISASWGAQRIKGISIRKAVAHAIRSLVKKKKNVDIAQKDVETSLIEAFLYPKHGPGQLWEAVAGDVEKAGGSIELRADVEKVFCENGRVVAAQVRHADGSVTREECGHFISTMPIRELVSKLEGIEIGDDVRRVAEGLAYRDFITVGLLLSSIELKDPAKPGRMPADNWIYIQESDVKVGRLQIFNNWSPYMVANKEDVWLGLEYFCQEGDELWTKKDEDFIELAKMEMEACGVIKASSVKDATVIRIQKAYPAYFGSYGEFSKVREFLDGIENLYCAGRNGQHRYNNMDHSMLSAIESVKNIASGSSSKDNIWAVNMEEEYHEEK